MRGDCTLASRSKREGEETQPSALNLCLGAGARGRVRATIMRRARDGVRVSIRIRIRISA